MPLSQRGRGEGTFGAMQGKAWSAGIRSTQGVWFGPYDDCDARDHAAKVVLKPSLMRACAATIAGATQ